MTVAGQHYRRARHFDRREAAVPVQTLPILNTNETVKTPLFRLTVSSIASLDCPKKFCDERIERNWDNSRGPVYAVANGQAVHKALHRLYLKRRGWEVDLSRLEPMAKDAVWSTSYPAETDRHEAVARVVKSVRAFVEADDDEAIEGTLDLEHQGQFTVYDKLTQTGLFVASAKLDRTLVRASEPGRGIIRESKTTKQKISLQEAFLQLWIFRKMYPHLTSWAVEYDFLDREDFRIVREVVEWEDVQGQSVLLLHKVMRLLRATDFPAVQCEQCTYCKFREECCTLQDEPVDLDALTNPELVP
jgi:hypothetical protein